MLVKEEKGTPVSTAGPFSEELWQPAAPKELTSRSGDKGRRFWIKERRVNKREAQENRTQRYYVR
jgi:hypothetical protein